MANLEDLKEVMMNLIHAIHFLYDDTNLSFNPKTTIGLVLKDKKRWKLFKN